MRRLHGLHKRTGRFSVGLLASVVAWLAGLGCGYESSYVPPSDGRARVIWNSKDSEATVSLSGGGLGRDCQLALRQLTGHARIPVENSFVQLPELESASPYRLSGYGQEYWVPRYYGPDIVVIHPGVPPHLPRPPLFVPAAPRPHVGAIYRGGPSVGGGGRSSGGFRLGGGSGGGGDAGKGLAILAVVAIVVMPVISITLATVRSESEKQAAEAIDAAHALNDMLRSGGSPCQPEAVPSLGGAP